MHGMIWRYNGVLGNCSIARSWVLSLLHVNRSLSQRRMNMRNVFIPFILLLLPTRLRQRAYRTSHVQNPYTFHSGRSSSQGYSFKSPLLHHIVRMHIHTHPPVSSCTSDLFHFPYPQANTTTRCLQEVLSATSPPSWDSTLMIGNSTEDLEFWLEVLAQVHDGSDVSAAVAVVGC